MRLELLRQVRQGQDPHYNVGDVVTLADERTAEQWVRLGWARELEVPEAVAKPPVPAPGKAIEKPPVDKMITRPGKAK